jgi:hypothetical protein
MTAQLSPIPPAIPERVAKLIASEAFKRGAASVRELDAQDMIAQGRFADGDKQLRLLRLALNHQTAKL